MSEASVNPSNVGAKPCTHATNLSPDPFLSTPSHYVLQQSVFFTWKMDSDAATILADDRVTQQTASVNGQTYRASFATPM